jgi:hypothetical protein
VPRRGRSPEWSCGLAFECPLGCAYNERAFRYLLGVQRRRAERSERPFVLLLVELDEHTRAGRRIDPTLATRIFASLWRSLRESDVVGWYREEHIAGAVLTGFENSGPAAADAARVVADKVEHALAGQLPPRVAHGLHVRTYQIQPRLTSRSPLT